MFFDLCLLDIKLLSLRTPPIIHANLKQKREAVRASPSVVVQLSSLIKHRAARYTAKINYFFISSVVGCILLIFSI